MMDTVYFLRPVGADGPVKIGVSAKPEDRLHFYSQMSPVPLEIAATIRGSHQLELRFHVLFEAHWSHHEWFRAHPHISAVIDAINSGAFDPDTLPRARRIGERAASWTEDARRRASWIRRLNLISERGVSVPRAVWQAYERYSYGRIPKRDPADAAIVEAFLADHPPLCRKRRVA